MGCSSTNESKPKFQSSSNNNNNFPSNNNQVVAQNNANSGNHNQLASQKTSFIFPKGKAILMKRNELKTGSTNNEPKEKIELFITLKDENYTNFKYNLSFGLQNDENGNIVNLGNTENSDTNSYIKDSYIYKTTFVLEYYFEKTQNLFIIFRNDKNEENLSTTIASIMSSKQNTVSILSKSSCKIIIQGKKVECDKKNFTFGLECPENLKLSNCFYVISSINDEKNWRRVYKSEERSSKQKFDLFEITCASLCLGDLDRRIKINFYDGDSYMQDEGIFTINQAVKGNITTNNGNDLRFHAEIVQNLSFVDLLTKGLEISLIIGVDFTASNGHPNDIKSLHYFGNEPNQYERAIRACGNILYYYDFDKKFPLLGFGGIPKNANQVEHVFPLNYSQDPSVSDVNEMINVYKSSLQITQLYGPTHFCPLISKTALLSQNKGNSSYIILLILTDGAIVDFNETKNQIIKASRLPISIIIVGVGNDNFAKMEELDGDDLPLSSPEEGIIERDIVQFVEFRKFENNPNKLAEELLREIPRQVEDFYRGKKIDFPN